jgi:hypothetical protein
MEALRKASTTCSTEGTFEHDFYIEAKPLLRHLVCCFIVSTLTDHTILRARILLQQILIRLAQRTLVMRSAVTNEFIDIIVILLNKWDGHRQWQKEYVYYSKQSAIIGVEVGLSSG